MTAVSSVSALVPEAGAVPAKFPAVQYQSASDYASAYIEHTIQTMNSIEPGALDAAASILLAAYTRQARVFCCGNGGSAAIANHLQCDHVKGVRTGTDLHPRVVSLSANVELLSAIANDLGYEHVYEYQLESQAAPGDVLIAVSSSGRSPNIVRAVNWARDHGLQVIALTGFDGGDVRVSADVAIHVDCANYGIVEDLHQSVMHMLAQYLRQSRMNADAIPPTVF